MQRILLTQVRHVVDVIKNGSDLTSDFEFYLARTDGIFVTSDGKLFGKGTSALDYKIRILMRNGNILFKFIHILLIQRISKLQFLIIEDLQ